LAILALRCAADTLAQPAGHDFAAVREFLWRRGDGLTGGSINIVTILLYDQIRGDVLHDQNLGYALALGMILITGVSNAAYIWLRARGERGLR
jgi:hypothetical protein